MCLFAFFTETSEEQSEYLKQGNMEMVKQMGCCLNIETQSPINVNTHLQEAYNYVSKYMYSGCVNITGF